MKKCIKNQHVVLKPSDKTCQCCKLQFLPKTMTITRGDPEIQIIYSE